MRRLFVSLGVLASVLAAGGCNSKKGERVSGGGATFIHPIMQKWSRVYESATGVQIDYSPSGSGDGIKKMTEQELDFGCSDAPMKADQLAEARNKGGEVIHVPLVMGGVAVVYNVPDAPDLKLTGPIIADIYRGKITSWDDRRIAELNPGVPLPGLGIVPVYRSDSSGTTNIFTEYLSKVSPEFQKEIGTSTSPKWPKLGTAQPKNDGVANHVKANAGAIGYVEVSYARTNGIPAARVKNARGQFTLPEADAVKAAAEWALSQPQTKEPYTLHELTYSLTNAEAEAAYPICGISYGLLYKKQSGPKGRALVAFFKWATTEGQKYAPDLHYAPLPEGLAEKVADRLGQVQFAE